MAVLGANKEDIPEPILEAHTIMIKDKKYKIKPLPHNQGLMLINYIMRVVLPSVGSGFDGMRSAEEFEDSTMFTEAMMHLSNKMSDDFLVTVSDTLLVGATVDGMPIDDNHFSCNYGTWRGVVKFALTENFASFFEEGLAQVATDLIQLVSPQFKE